MNKKSNSKKDQRFNNILSFYRETQDISKTLSKFGKYKNDIYSVFEHENVLIDDQLITDIFIGKIIMHGNSFPCLIKPRISMFKNNITNTFMIRVVNYLNNRFNDSLSIQETISRIYHKLENRPTCKQCGKKLKFQKLSFPFGIFCSKKCSNNNEETKQHLIETCLKKYGVTNTAKAECVKQNAKKHFQEKYGVANPWQSEEIKQIAKQTKKQKYGDENFNNREKSEITCLTKYGVRVSSQNAEVQRKASISYHMVVYDKYGTEWPMQNKEVKQKFKNTMITNYGSTSYLTSNDFKQKCIELYGVENPMQFNEIRKKTTQKYVFKEINFDSAPEIAFYMWLNDVKEILDIDFEYQPNISFEYVFDNKVHKYFPDFKVGDQCFEIKGDHFFKDGKMICPFRYKDWSDEQYQYECDKYEAKHQCMLKNNIIILTNDDYRFFIDYVKQTYGNTFLNQFKNK